MAVDPPLVVAVRLSEADDEAERGRLVAPALARAVAGFFDATAVFGSFGMANRLGLEGLADGVDN